MNASHQAHKGVPYDIFKCVKSPDRNFTIGPRGESPCGSSSVAQWRAYWLGLLKLEKSKIRIPNSTRSSCNRALARLYSGLVRVGHCHLSVIYGGDVCKKKVPLCNAAEVHSVCFCVLRGE